MRKQRIVALNIERKDEERERKKREQEMILYIIYLFYVSKQFGTQ